MDRSVDAETAAIYINKVLSIPATIRPSCGHCPARNVLSSMATLLILSTIQWISHLHLNRYHRHHEYYSWCLCPLHATPYHTGQLACYWLTTRNQISPVCTPLQTPIPITLPSSKIFHQQTELYVRCNIIWYQHRQSWKKTNSVPYLCPYLKFNTHWWLDTVRSQEDVLERSVEKEVRPNKGDIGRQLKVAVRHLAAKSWVE